MNDEAQKPTILLEENKRLSESMLYRLQRDYFDKESIQAWVNQVPFYVTSNPFIAKTYATLVVHFILDWQKTNPLSEKDPFYLLELGTGSGRFSFYVIKALVAQLEKAGLKNLPFCYIMSDVTQNNLNYYEQQPALKPYLEKGLLDFAIYNMEVEKPIHLIKKNIDLTSQLLKNPLIVFANYIFDTISQDAFTVRQKQLYELLITLKTDSHNLKNNQPINLDRLESSYQLREIKKPYYKDPLLNTILENYQQTLEESSFLFPIGSLKALQYLSHLANEKLLLLSSDKGYSNLEALDHHGHPTLSFHGSFSLMVNFHALAEYFKHTGGDFFMQTPRRGIKTSIFCKGFKLADCPFTQLSIQEKIEGFSPADYFTLHRRISASFQECDLETLCAHLELSAWDPHVFLKIKTRLHSLLQETEGETLEFFAQRLPILAANDYPLPKGDCLLFEVALFFHALKKNELALHYYEKARPYLGESFSLYYNIGLCQHQLGDNSNALSYFKKALHLNPTSSEAKEWLNYLEKNFS